MKKIKIMLMSALVVATVGGALAFKAKSPGNWHCGTAATSCPNAVAEEFTVDGVNPFNQIGICTNSGLTTIGCVPVKLEN